MYEFGFKFLFVVDVCGLYVCTYYLLYFDVVRGGDHRVYNLKLSTWILLSGSPLQKMSNISVRTDQTKYV